MVCVQNPGKSCIYVNREKKTAKLSAVWTNLFQRISQFVRLKQLLYTYNASCGKSQDSFPKQEPIEVEKKAYIVWAELVMLRRSHHKAIVWYSW